MRGINATARADGLWRWLRLLPLLGCHNPERLEGLVQTMEPLAVEAAKERAATDLNCSAVKTTVLSREHGDLANQYNLHRVVYRIQAEGCQLSTVYAVACVPNAGAAPYPKAGAFSACSSAARRQSVPDAFDPRCGQREEGKISRYSIRAEPYEFEGDRARSALLIIDMQRDFVEPGGFGEALGNDVSPLRAAIEPTRKVLERARKLGMLVVHTREGHRICRPPAKIVRGRCIDPDRRCGRDGPAARAWRARARHRAKLYPVAGEPIVDKPSKGEFYATDLELILRDRGIASLIVCGVTTEVCVNTTVREANDRGYECLVLSDCVGSYSRVSDSRPGDDQGAGGHLRVGVRLGERARRSRHSLTSAAIVYAPCFPARSWVRGCVAPAVAASTASLPAR